MDTHIEHRRERPIKFQKKDKIHLPKQINTETYILHPHTYPKTNTHRHTHTYIYTHTHTHTNTHTSTHTPIR